MRKTTNINIRGVIMSKKINRNDPCWCGSGRKYKVCHEMFDDKIAKIAHQGHIVPTHNLIKNAEQIEKIKESAKINIAVLDEIQKTIHEGMSTAEIDKIVYDMTTDMGGIPAPLNYEGFPYSVCTSVNDQVCHGFPSPDVILKSGDIINVDCSTILNGYFSDSSRMFCIGDVSPEKKKLVDVTKEAMLKGLEQVKPWGFLGDMGQAVHDNAKKHGYKDGDFSYNTGKLRCPTCDGTGVISLDVQFLPDVDIPCPDCRGSRYSKVAGLIRRENSAGEFHSLPELMDMDINSALDACADLKSISQKLRVLHDLGLGYLTLGEETPSLSGGEAQRLKLASEMGRGQSDSVFVFDEPTIGLHPSDVMTLLSVFQSLIDHGATVIVIEHDLDVIRNADYIIDMGPGGGAEGGRIVATGSPDQIREAKDSATGSFI